MVIIKFLGILVLIVVSVAVILFVTILSKFLNIFRTFRGQAATSRHNKNNITRQFPDSQNHVTAK